VALAMALGGYEPLAAQEPRLRDTLFGYTDGVSVGFFSADSKLLVTGPTLHDSMTKLWDLATGKSTDIGEKSSAPLFFSADGKSLFLSSYPQRGIQIYDVSSGKVNGLLPEGLALSPDGKNQVLSDDQGFILNGLAPPNDERDPIILTGAGLRGLGAPLRPVQFSPDSKTLGIKDKDRNVTLWDVASGKSKTLPKTAGLWFVFSPDGKTLIAESGTKPKAVEMGSLNDPGKELFDVATGRSIATLDLGKPALRFNFMVFSPDSKTVASGSARTIKLWNARNGKAVATFASPALVSSGNLVFTPDGESLVARAGGTLKFWNLASGKISASLPMPLDSPPLLAFSPDGKTLATGGKDGRILLWDLPDARSKGK
jgi:WD40 repeat protein